MVKLDSMHRHIKTAYTNLRENTGIHGLHENEFFLMVIRLRSGHMTKNYCSGYSWFHIDTFLFCSVSSTHPSIHPWMHPFLPPLSSTLPACHSIHLPFLHPSPSLSLLSHENPISRGWLLTLQEKKAMAETKGWEALLAETLNQNFLNLSSSPPQFVLRE